VSAHVVVVASRSLQDHLFTSKHIDNIRSVLLKQTTHLGTVKDEPGNKKNSQLDVSVTSTAVLEQVSKDEQTPLMSYFSLMNFMPMGAFGVVGRRVNESRAPCVSV
jgi:hypothetical protein